MKRISLRLPGDERLRVALVALVATYIFFYEYLAPFRRFHIFSDIQGYHYPLQRYAFDAFKEGRFPQWDPSIYCGISFVGNVQAALLYPPTWLLYLASWGYRQIPFHMLECLAFAHIWLGFLLCYCWLRGRGLSQLPGALGGGVFAFGGYMISQIVHLGVVTGMAWMPLGLWGIDEAVERRHWRPLWKTALASAMCFLAGYPPSWVVFCATCFVYGLASRAHWRAASGVCGAVAASTLLAMVQWLPAAQAHAFMVYDEKYGGGVNSWRALIPYLVPNWIDFNLHTTAPWPDDTTYLYLGLPAIFAMAWALRRRALGPYRQGIIAAAFCLILATNPHYLVYKLMVHVQFLERMTQSYNFYEGAAAMAALLTAIALHDFLERAPARTTPRWLLPAALTAILLWSVRQILLGRHGGIFPAGGRAVAATAAAALLFAIALWTLRAESGIRRARLSAALLLMVAVDYKVFGTNRRFNTMNGDGDEPQNLQGIRGVNAIAYQALWMNRQYRIATDEDGGPAPTDLREWGLATPQGFDPFLPGQYHELVERWVKFRTNRLFFLDFENEEMLQSLGVRYVMTHEGAGNDPHLAASPNFRLLGPDDSYYRVYEYLHARLPFGWEDGSGSVQPTAWMPERRAFLAASATGGRFVFREQFFPGWTATVDGRPAAVERWGGAFQAIHAGPGAHTIVVEYHTPFLLPGAAISVLALAGLAIVIVSDQRKRQSVSARREELRLESHTPLTFVVPPSAL
ncbi:MAG TPA: hypothetical protein VGH38_30800 [Bryobacteraceae bacterium]